MLAQINVPMDPYPLLVFHQVEYRNPFLWTVLIRGYSIQGPLKEAVRLYNAMRREDISPVSFTLTALLNGCSDELELNLGRQIHCQGIKIGGFYKDLFVHNILTDMYVKCSCLGFMSERDEALDFFYRMQSGGVETDELTLIGVISASAQLGAAKYANWARDVVEAYGFGPANHVMCGNVEEAYKVFEKMMEKNVFSYSSMIVGFAMRGYANAALDLFEEMVKTEVKPNKVTCIGVLTACTHAGLVERCRHLFDIMEKHYGVEPSIEHYACMIDLLGRAGQLEESLNSGCWGALLGACRIHGNPEIAKVAANHLFELEHDSIGNYVLLVNTYASAGRWEDVLGGVIHEFYAGDMTHTNSKEIKEALEDLIGLLKSHGYKPNLLARILLTYNEKPALAYELLVTDSAEPIIRIMENLRICEDCRSFMCGASQITGKEIIVGDNKRFHHFHNGVCSCGNIW
ncbi:unnamed protein product [Withania somnifera]